MFKSLIRAMQLQRGLLRWAFLALAAYLCFTAWPVPVVAGMVFPGPDE